MNDLQHKKATEQTMDNPIVTPLLTDLYQISMAQAYWKSGRHNTPATFDLFFRSPPFGGSLVVCAGLDSVVSFLHNFRFTKEQTAYISTQLECEPEFISYLEGIDTSTTTLYAQQEGSLVPPLVPLLRVSGPLIVVQLLETTILNLTNFASLVSTNALRFRIAAPAVKLYEYGLRRAQGPDGALTASRSCFLAGFDGTSNMTAGLMYGIPVRGTHAHSFVQSFQFSEQNPIQMSVLSAADGRTSSLEAFRNRAFEIRMILAPGSSESELEAFVSYAVSYPSIFSSLVDTYSSLRSGVPNFVSVAFALAELGFDSIGVRIDSGSLGPLSLKVQELFDDTLEQYLIKVPMAQTQCRKMVCGLKIMASNDITVSKLLTLREQPHAISAYGIGTHLVTCMEQPALGCVYKLSSIGDIPCMKFSEEASKKTLPGEKMVYRLYDEDGYAAYDAITLSSETAPRVGVENTFLDRYDPSERVTIVPSSVEELLKRIWPRSSSEAISGNSSLLRGQKLLTQQRMQMRNCYLGVVQEAVRYPVLFSESLFSLQEQLRKSEGYPT